MVRCSSRRRRTRQLRLTVERRNSLVRQIRRRLAWWPQQLTVPMAEFNAHHAARGRRARRLRGERRLRSQSVGTTAPADEQPVRGATRHFYADFFGCCRRWATSHRRLTTHIDHAYDPVLMADGAHLRRAPVIPASSCAGATCSACEPSRSSRKLAPACVHRATICSPGGGVLAHQWGSTSFVFSTTTSYHRADIP